jgi:predicted metal-dependent phosphotriesterase family hydrolase
MMATRREFLKQTSAAGLVAATPWHIARGAQTDAPTRASSPAGRTPGIVQTVLGPLDASKLGFTLTHEHICKNPSERFGGRVNSVAKAVDKLKEARDAGINTVVDVTPLDVGRDVRFGQEVSRKSGMQIVACTGQHFFAPESYNARTMEEITELLIREIEQGIDGTTSKPVLSKSRLVMTP